MFRFNKMSVFIVICFILILTSPSFAQDNETNDIICENDANLSILFVDIYVNASNNDVGDGSKENPYKNLDNIKIEKDSIVHLTNGEYIYKSFRSLNNVSIIGESTNDTIIYCNNLEITSNKLYLKNLTIIGATFKNQGDFSAENVVFKNSKGHELDEYGNSYGGSIYTAYRADDETFHLISLDNCYFIENTAEYGGAIYIDDGDMEIINCNFINNYAYNYGGAISIVNANKVTIKKSKFIDDYSLNDCGGAIYILSSSLTVDNVDVINCSATFGSAITGLNAKLDINKLYSYGNNAKYDGGTIYQMYGSALITDSYFINNSARNGGALFLDNLTSLMLISNKFINNSAKLSAGAFYSLLNKEYSNLGNTYENNHALENNDICNMYRINTNIQSSDYITFQYTPKGDVVLPKYYNLVDDGYVTSVKDQEDGGNCWSFAILAALESCILKLTNISYDLSEENMKNLMASFSDYGWQIDVNEGGYDDMGVGYLVGWLGPILESEDIYDDKSTLSPLLNSLLHIQNIVYLKRNDYLDNNAIKEAILKYGGVATGIYYSGLYLLGDSYYYYDTIMPSNHAVTIVGWDDTYSKYNFNHIPAGDGAFIAKNSWGTDWGNNGYFYVSYYDTKFAQVGQNEVSYTFILNDTIKYDKNYQYDIAGKTDYLITGQNTIWYQNIFKATDEEYLAAVSTYFNTITNWDVSVYVNDIFKINKSGTSSAGYYTITLGDLIKLNPDDVFKVIFKLHCDEYANVPIVESNYINKVPFSNGISFFSKDGENWIDLFNYTFSDFNHRYSSQVACIKAFTIFNNLNSNITLDVSDKGIQSANIKAFVSDQYGNLINSGEVIFTIDGIKYHVNVTNGIANLSHIFKKGLNEIFAEFSSENYNNSFSKEEINFNEAEIFLETKNIQYGENLVAYITIIDNEGNLLNDDVILEINNNTYKVHVNGKISYKFPILLNVGQYDVNLKYNQTLSKKNIINVTKANINLNVKLDELRNNLTINLQFSKAINELVNIKIDNKNYSINTSYGGANLFLDDLDYGTHEINISFENKNYESIYKNYTIKTEVYKSKMTSIGLNYVDDGIYYEINVSMLNGTPIVGEKINFTIGGDTYENTTNLNGNVGFLFNMINGEYPIKILFNGYDDIVGCVLSDVLNIVRIPVILTNVDVPSEIKLYDDKYVSINFSDNANGKLYISIDDITYLNETFKLNHLEIPLSNLKIGNHEICISYFGIEGYNYFNQFKISVTKTNIPISIIAENLYVGEIAKITFNLPITAQGYIFVDVAGKNYYSQITNGQAVFNINGLSFGEKILSYMYDGDKNYLPTSGDSLINIKYIASLINNKNVVMSYTDGSTYKVQVLNSNDEPLTNGNVLINLGGKSYIVNVDKSGWISFKLNLKPNNYIITVEYNGIKVSNKIIVKSILKVYNFKIKKSAKNVVIKSTLLKINGKYLNNKKITFKFNGKKYVSKTNKKGVAKITIKKNILKKLKINKKYSIQVSYLKDTVKKTVIVKK